MHEVRLFTNADVVTMDHRARDAGAILTRGERIVDVGDEDAIRAATPDIDVETDLDGRTVIPGFVDGHCHLELTCQALEQHLLMQSPPVESLTEILAAIAERRLAQPEGWIVVRGSFAMQQKVTDGRLLVREELDRVSPRAPVMVLAGLHVASLNTAALTELGLLSEPQPTWRSVHRTSAGELTGVVTEVWDLLPAAAVEDVLDCLRRHLVPTFTANGVTSVCTIPTSANDVRALHVLERAGELPMRVRFYAHVPRVGSLDTVLAWGTQSGFGSTMLRFGGVKIFVDGEGADAYGEPRSDLKWTTDELTDLVRQADAAGIQLMMHAVTEEAIAAACAAVWAARAGLEPREYPRHRIEHAGDDATPANVPALLDTRLLIVTTPHFAASAGTVPESFQPLRSLLDAGLRVVGSSDSTGTVPDATAPLRNIWLACNRLDASGKPSPHRIRPDEALHLFTTAAAYGCHEEDEKGSISPGKFADFAVLSANPLRVDPTELDRVSVESTIVGAQRVHGG